MTSDRILILRSLPKILKPSLAKIFLKYLKLSTKKLKRINFLWTEVNIFKKFVLQKNYKKSPNNLDFFHKPIYFFFSLQTSIKNDRLIKLNYIYYLLNSSLKNVY
jgi:hypothetical protein